MIVPVLFMFIAIATIGSGMLVEQLARAKAALNDRVAYAADLAISLGENQLLTALQATIAANVSAQRPVGSGIDGNYAQQTPLVRLPGTNVYYTTYEQINGDTSMSAPATTDTAQNLQTSNYAQEQRLSVVVTAQIQGAPPASALLAKRSRLVTVRIFGVSPFAIIDGSRDVATAADDASAEGDPAGVQARPGDPATPDPARPDQYHDTTLKVRYNCAGPDNAPPDPGTDQKTWGVQNSPAIDERCNPTPPPWATSGAPPTIGDGNAFSTAQWGNANTNTTSWTR